MTESTDKYDGGTGFGPQVYAAYIAAKGRLMSARPGTRTAMWSLKYPANEVPASVVPSTIGNYFVGLEDGVWDIVEELKSRDCPNEQIILMGYSQGAMVMHRAIVDMVNQGFGAKLDRVAGAILIADGDRLPADNMTRYGSAGSVFFGVAHSFAAFAAPRQYLLPASMTSRIHSICYARDIVCDHSMLGAATGLGIHTNSYDLAAVTPLGQAAMNSALARAPWNQPAPPPQQPPAQVPAPRDRLEINQALERGSALRSANGRYELALQSSDGNLVLYAEGRPVWTTRTPGGQRLIMQSDGNLVLYTAQGKAIWSTFTDGKGGRTLVLQDDQNLVLYAPGRAVWASNTVAAAPPPPPPPPPPPNPLQSYFSTVVQWDGDTKPQKTAWFVDSRGRRRHIQTTDVYSCLMDKGVRGPFRLPASTLNQLPDLTGVGAQCVSDGDVNYDGIVNVKDLSIVISRWGTRDRTADQNRNGVVDISDISVVISRWGEVRNGGPQPAARMAAAIAMTDVGNLKDFGGRSEAIGTSADGSTIGGNAAQAGGDLTPVVWTSPSSEPQVVDVPGLDDEVMFDFADSGQSVGSGKDASGASRAWLRRADGSLQVLPLGSASDTYATRLNGDGSIAGFVGGAQTRAVVWDSADEQPRALESVEGINSAAAGIAADGTVVGEIDQVATVWDPDGRLVSTEPGRAVDVNASTRLIVPPPDADGISQPALVNGFTRHPLQPVAGQPATVARESTDLEEGGIAVGNSGHVPVLWSQYGMAEPLPLPNGAQLGAVRSVAGDRAVGWVSAGPDEVRHAQMWQNVSVPPTLVTLTAPSAVSSDQLPLSGDTQNATPEARVQIQQNVDGLWLSTGTPVGLNSGRWEATMAHGVAPGGSARLRVRLILEGDVLATSAEVVVPVAGAPMPAETLSPSGPPPSRQAGPLPSPPSTEHPAPRRPAIPSTTRVRALKGRSALLIDINPNLRKADYRVTILRRAGEGWSVLKRRQTHGQKDRLTINLPRGKYRVRLNPQHGVSASNSATVRLTR